ncbi:MAG TPA: hypothetical protein VGS13_16030, partial [Stellaceae bacterium]|nr:hypothetical protein [Stellaceae bacterium]
MSIITTQTITQTVTLGPGTYPNYASPLTITSTGVVEVNSTIAGVAGILGPVGPAGTVTNLGTVASIGSQGIGVYLLSGGFVTNGASGATAALITGSETGIDISGSAGTIANFGTIASTATAPIGTGVYLGAGGSVSNGATNATGAVIAASKFGVYIQNNAGTVVNFGSITSSADTGVWLNTGTIVNGPSGATHALISGAFDGVFIAVGNGNVANYGTVVSGNGKDGVCLYAGGSVSNGQSGAAAALISGYAWGVEIQHSAGTVINFATVESTGTAGTTSGVLLSAGGTVTDAGTIRGASGTAIGFGGTSASRLILDPGYHLGGKAFGSTSAGATNTLELGSAAGTGTLSGLGSSFVHFGAVGVDAGAGWVLASTNAIGAGQTLSVAGQLADLGTLTNAGVITGGGKLVVDPASLINTGSIGMAVTLATGSYLDNKPSGAIAVAGVAVLGSGRGTVVNQGGIASAAGVAVQLQAGGSVTNKSAGSITGGGGGV